MSQHSDGKDLFERQLQKRRHVVDQLLASTLDWATAQPGTLTHFLEQYSVHDSSWIGVGIDPLEEQAILAFEWDTFWTQERVPYPSNQVAYWPTLLLRLNKFFLYYYDKHDQIPYASSHVDGAETRLVTSEEREELLTCFSGSLKLASSGTDFLFAGNLVFTTLIGDMGKWHFLHSNHVDVLCLNEDGQPILIPSI
jgi:hypothetical protein